MIAITVSTRYSKILAKIIKQNAKFFTYWIIITDKNDLDTIKVIDDAKLYFNNIIVRYHDFYINDAKFDKSGAIYNAQKFIDEELLHLLDDTRILILDSDIYLPDNFLDFVPSSKNIESDVLYGVNQRNDFYSYQNFLDNNVDKEYIAPHSNYLHWAGFFQLYNNNKKQNNNYKYYYPSHSNNCSKYDLIFIKLFGSNTKILKDLNVSHLGREWVNWNGRNNYNDMIGI